MTAADPGSVAVSKLLNDEYVRDVKGYLPTANIAFLDELLVELLKSQFSLRMRLATQQLSKSSEMRKVRRDVARVRTLLTEKAKQA